MLTKSDIILIYKIVNERIVGVSIASQEYNTLALLRQKLCQELTKLGGKCDGPL